MEHPIQKTQDMPARIIWIRAALFWCLLHDYECTYCAQCHYKLTREQASWSHETLRELGGLGARLPDIGPSREKLDRRGTGFMLYARRASISELSDITMMQSKGDLGFYLVEGVQFQL